MKGICPYCDSIVRLTMTGEYFRSLAHIKGNAVCSGSGMWYGIVKPKDEP